MNWTFFLAGCNDFPMKLQTIVLTRQSGKYKATTSQIAVLRFAQYPKLDQGNYHTGTVQT